MAEIKLVLTRDRAIHRTLIWWQRKDYKVEILMHSLKKYFDIMGGGGGGGET